MSTLMTDMMINIIKHTVLYTGMLVLDLVSSGASSGVLSNGLFPQFYLKDDLKQQYNNDIVYLVCTKWRTVSKE